MVMRRHIAFFRLRHFVMVPGAVGCVRNGFLPMPFQQVKVGQQRKAQKGQRAQDGQQFPHSAGIRTASGPSVKA